MFGSYVGGVIVMIFIFLLRLDVAINYKKLTWREIICMVTERRNSVASNSLTITPFFFHRNCMCHTTKVGKLRNGDTY